MQTRKKQKDCKVALTPAGNQLEQKRFLRKWWWFDPVHANEKDNVSLAWETLRRTRSYLALWKKLNKETMPLLKHKGKPTLAGLFQQMHLGQRVHQALGQPYFDLIRQGFDPGKTWLELDEAQRLMVRGFVVRDGVALKINREISLPRQNSPRPFVGVGVVGLDRGESGKLTFGKSAGAVFKNIESAEYFQGLRLDTPGPYAFVIFDTRGGRDALLVSFDAAMQRKLGTQLPAPGGEIDADYWAEVAEKTTRFAIRWNPDDGSPVDFWEPEVRENNIRVKTKEWAIFPSDEPAKAILLVSARYGPATLRSVLHTQLKSPKFKKWHSPCVAFWKALTHRGKSVFHPERDLPPAEKPRRGAQRKDLWFGLAANDLITDGVPLGKSSAEGAFLFKQCSSTQSLYNAQASAATRLRELDESAGRLDKNLAHWNKQSAKLWNSGFFQAVADSLESL